MLLRGNDKLTSKTTKKIRQNTLSNLLRHIYQHVSFYPQKRSSAKALQYAHKTGSLTVEAAMVLPLFLFAAVVVLGFFPMLLLQMQVNNGLQYAARLTAVSCQMEDQSEGLLLGQSRILFDRYMKEHSQRADMLGQGGSQISLLGSDLSGDYITLVASYQVKLPVAFWNVSELPVKQQVRMKKWTGAPTGFGDSEAGNLVYITPEGEAYHKTASCPFLDLTTHSVLQAEVDALRASDGSRYYPCSCYKGENLVYITDYGTMYHGNSECMSLKRTIYLTNPEDVHGRHPCSKCWGEE